MWQGLWFGGRHVVEVARSDSEATALSHTIDERIFASITQKADDPSRGEKVSIFNPRSVCVPLQE